MYQRFITPEMHYDDWAPSYDSDIRGWDYHAPEKLFAQIKGALYAQPDRARLLDVGIGTGALSKKCKNIRDDLEITGLDISTKMLESCAQQQVADRLMKCDVSQDLFPCEDNLFHIVLASGLMENVENIRHALSEMARVTRKGGVMAFTFMPTTTNKVTETLAKKLRPGRTAEGKFVLGNLNLYRHNADNIKTWLTMKNMQCLQQESFVGYRTYVVVAVRYDLIIARKI